MIKIQRAKEGKVFLEGTAAVFGQLSKGTIKGHKERVMREAFEKVLDDSELDVVLAVEHSKTPLARTINGTLKLWTDDKGLHYSALMPNTTLGADVVEMVDRGDYQENSFKGSAKIHIVRDKESQELVRNIVEMVDLEDVSIVSRAEYPNTIIEKVVRNLTNESMTDEEKKELIARAEKAEARVEELERAAEEDKPEEVEAAEEDKPEEDKPEEVEAEEVEAAEEDKPEEVEAAEEDKPEEDKPEEVERNKQNVQIVKIKGMDYKKVFKESIERALAGNSKETIELVERAAGDGTSSNYTNVIPEYVKGLDVVGKKPIWAEMGCDYFPAVGTFNLPYESPVVGEKLAELASVTKQLETQDGTLVTPARYQVTKEFTQSAMAQMTPEAFAVHMHNLEQGCDRKVTQDIFAIVFNVATKQAAQEVDITAFSEAGLDAISGACDTDNDISYVMSRTLFHAKKSTKLDAGSGMHIMKADGTAGKTWEDKKIFYSALCASDLKYAGGDMSKVTVADWNKSQVIIDNVTKADTGIVRVHFVKLMAVALTNPFAFAATKTLV